MNRPAGQVGSGPKSRIN